MPVKVRDAFCPGVVVLTVAAGPAAVIVPVTPAGTLCRVRFIVPVNIGPGSMMIV